MPAMPPFSPPPRARRPTRAAARLAAPLLAGALAGLLAGCGPKEDQFPPVCPVLSLLPDAGDVTRFAGGGQDVTNLVLRARVTAIPANCEAPAANQIRATLHVDADVQRGPAAAAGAVAPLPYFIALMHGEDVVSEQDFTLAPAFAGNVNVTSVHGDDIELLLPVSKTATAAAYHIYIGFRLTPDQLAYNRAHPHP